MRVVLSRTPGEIDVQIRAAGRCTEGFSATADTKGDLRAVAHRIAWAVDRCVAGSTRQQLARSRVASN